MPHLDLLKPWLTFVVILLPLLHLERWIHRHLYGVGWLLTQDKERATVLYYLILLPGVFLHEFTQWLVAGALKLKLGKIRVWPRPQADGALRLDFVRLSRNTGRAGRAVFEFAPIAAAIGVVLFISHNIFNVGGLSIALSTGELPIIQAEIGRLLGTPDFWLWLYLLFTVGNAMLPTTPVEEQDWPVRAAVFAGMTALLIAVAFLGESVQATLEPILRGGLDTLATAFGTILVLDILVVLALMITEKLLERLTGRRANYPQARRERPTQPEPGGETPLPASEAPERVTERRLPIPPPPDSQQRAALLPQADSPALPQPGALMTSAKDSPGDRDYRPARRSSFNAPDTETEANALPVEPEYSQALEDEPAEDSATIASEPPDHDDELYYEDLEDIP